MSAALPAHGAHAREAGQLLHTAQRFLETESKSSELVREALRHIERASLEFEALKQTSDDEAVGTHIALAIDEIQNALACLERAKLVTPSAQGAIAQLARAQSLFAPHANLARARRGVVIQDLVSSGGPSQSSDKHDKS